MFTSLELTFPKSVLSDGAAPNEHSWGLDSHVKYVYPATKHAVDSFVLHWYDGDARPPAEIKSLIGGRKFNDQGSIYIGEEGVLYSPYIGAAALPGREVQGLQVPRSRRREPLSSVR